MASSLYKSLASSNNNQNGSVYDIFGGPKAFQEKLNGFAENFRRQANCTPEQMVRRMMSSGQMTQQQFDQFSRIASAITGKK